MSWPALRSWGVPRTESGAVQVVDHPVTRENLHADEVDGAQLLVRFEAARIALRLAFELAHDALGNEQLATSARPTPQTT